jgi:hypothetical protein
MTITVFPLRLMKAVIMPRKSERLALVLTKTHQAMRRELSASRLTPSREVECANMLLGCADRVSITELWRQLGFNRPHDLPVRGQGSGYRYSDGSQLSEQLTSAGC